ncbi:hypothetical protein BJY01DRAFT_209972 [Aspergillus pseudoustus]|uniref:Uncharacterized protein n=1 Tax=Aspergillus pseudoustus TaxID=1810923 RepID=A0ABR4KDM4_9EURO
MDRDRLGIWVFYLSVHHQGTALPAKLPKVQRLGLVLALVLGRLHLPALLYFFLPLFPPSKEEKKPRRRDACARGGA